MKSFFVALVSLASFTSAESLNSMGTGPDLTGDFLTGFESGIFLRESEEQYNDYNCPKAQIQHDDFQKVKEMLPAVKSMMGIMNKGPDGEEMVNMLESLTVFMNHADELIGVFQTSYTGGDFCAGLTFGYKGSSLLFTIASDIITKNLESANIPKKK